MTYERFLDKSCPYHVSSYFYRVEFQMRGAPHIHCLLWLEDGDGNPAPTFWNEESKEKSDLKMKIKDIEDIATMHISGSEDDMKCDEHQKVFQEKRDEIMNCLEC